MNDALISTIQTYDEIAKEYAIAAETKLTPEIINSFLAKLTKRAKILDVGCGSGRDAQYMADRGFRVVGIDLSKELLSEAKELHPSFTFQIMDVRDLSFDAEEFDGVWSNGALHHLVRAELPRALQEIHRVLKDEGLFVFSVKKGDGDEMKSESLSNGKERFFTYYQKNELKKLLNDSGFTVLKLIVKRSSSRNLDWIFVMAQKI